MLQVAAAMKYVPVDPEAPTQTGLQKRQERLKKNSRKQDESRRTEEVRSEMSKTSKESRDGNRHR